MHIKIVDAYALGYIQQYTNAILVKDGGEVQAIYGFLQALRSSFKANPDTLHVFVWDGWAKWRRQVLPGYKTTKELNSVQVQNRLSFDAQVPWIRKALQYLPVVQLEHPEAEAGDVVWGLSMQLSAMGHLVTLEGVQKSWLQSVNARVRWKNLRKPYQLLDTDNFRKKSDYESPGLVSSVLALGGDTDNDIPGVPGIANSRALHLLNKYGSLDALLHAAGDFVVFSQESKHYQALALEQWQDQARKNFSLLDFKSGPALQGEACEQIWGELDVLNLFELLVDLEFHSLQVQFDSWQKPFLGNTMAQGSAHGLKRALKNIGGSWAGA